MHGRSLRSCLDPDKDGVSSKMKVYTICVRSAMVYGTETWAINVEQGTRLERTEMKMVRWMCGVSLRMWREDARDHVKWRRLLWGSRRPTPA